MSGVSKTVTYDGVKFEIRKMLPIEAKRVFLHHVRPMLSGALQAPSSEGEEPGMVMWRMIMAAFTNAPAEHYDKISYAMAESILVTRDGEERFLANNEEWAFQNLEGAHMMLVDARAFTVNFRAWWPAVASELPQLISDIKSLQLGT